MAYPGPDAFLGSQHGQTSHANGGFGDRFASTSYAYPYSYNAAAGHSTGPPSYATDSVASRAQHGYEPSIAPHDSISNAGDARDDAVTSYGGQDWATRDPYGGQPSRFSEVRQSSGSRPNSGLQTDHDLNRDSNDHFRNRDSAANLPLMNHQGYAGRPNHDSDGRSSHGSHDEEASMMDDDTLVGQHGRRDYLKNSAHLSHTRDSEKGFRESYPPAPHISPGYEKRASTFDIVGASEPTKRPNVFIRQFRDTTPLEQKIANHKRGVGVQDRPWMCYMFAVICVAVFIAELVKSAQVTGKAISTSPFNYMIGPSSEMLINLGSRFTACMRSVPEVQSMNFACLNNTNTICTLEDICGFGGFGADDVPHQTFRFFTPIWLHVGVVHLLLNLLVLLTSSGLVEKQMGSLKFTILYIISGVFGFVLGGNFALVGLASMGASGAIFGTHAAVLVDLIMHWSITDRPKRLLFALIFELIVGVGLGYIPGIDNFSHIGGFAIGLLLSVVLFPVVHLNKTRRLTVYIVRGVALVGACVMFGVLINNFFTSDPNSACEWCRYLSCWPTASNNHCKGTGLSTTTTTTTSGASGSSTPGTVGSQVNTSLSFIYLVTFFSGSFFFRSSKRRSVQASKTTL